MLIEGDNLAVLKKLLPRYREKVKMIYIDPPYNSGNKFVYKDKFKSHKEWLGMLRPRLKLAKDFLSFDGAMFISIDDKEMPHLRLLLDDIFGEDNFVTQFVWLTKQEAKGIPPKTMALINHEYVICYAKDKSRFSFRGVKRLADGFKNPDNDQRGPWKRQYLQRFGLGFKDRTIVNPENGMRFTFPSPYTEAKINAWIKEGRIMFPKTPNRYPAKKEFLNEYQNPNTPALSFLGLFSTKVNSEKLKKMMDGEKLFEYSKPVDLIKHLVGITTDDGIVMDFFAGTGTTGEAVLRLNAENGTKIEYVLIQEKIALPHSKYPTLTALIKARLDKVSKETGGGD